MIDETERKTRDTNRRCCMIILELLQYLARQRLAMHGDNDEESNFNQLLKARSKSYPELKDWSSKKGGKFTSHKIQREILNSMSNQDMRKLLELVGINFYSMMCDEYKDISNKEQLSF